MSSGRHVLRRKLCLPGGIFFPKKFSVLARASDGPTWPPPKNEPIHPQSNTLSWLIKTWGGRNPKKQQKGRTRANADILDAISEGRCESRHVNLSNIHPVIHLSYGTAVALLLKWLVRGDFWPGQVNPMWQMQDWFAGRWNDRFIDMSFDVEKMLGRIILNAKNPWKNF